MTLPDHPVELLELAYKDFLATQQDPRYKIDLARWHYYFQDRNVCHVCLAGTVMAQTLKIPVENTHYAHDFEDKEAAKFYALDSLVQGQILEYIARLGYCIPLNEYDPLLELKRCCPSVNPDIQHVNEWLQSVLVALKELQERSGFSRSDAEPHFKVH